LPTLPSYDLKSRAELSKLCPVCRISKPTDQFGFFKEKRVGGSYRQYFNTYCKPCAAAKAKKWDKDNHQIVAERIKLRSLGLLAQIIEAYGGKCSCCGEKSSMFLTIDHKNNDGSKHRSMGLTGRMFYKWIIDSGFPQDLQLLCWNCNCGRQRNGGVCPHNTI
jgi:hypothetical protein